MPFSASKVYIVFVWSVAQGSSLVGINVSAKQIVSIFSFEVGQASEMVTTGLQHDATTQKQNYFYYYWSHFHQSHHSLPHCLEAGTVNVKTSLLFSQPVLETRASKLCQNIQPTQHLITKKNGNKISHIRL